MEEKKKINGNASIYDGELTVRAYMAMSAMGGFLQGGNHSDPNEIAELSVMMADKLIEALNK